MGSKQHGEAMIGITLFTGKEAQAYTDQDGNHGLQQCNNLFHFLILFLLCKFYNIVHLGHDTLIIFPSMGHHAVGAVFDALFGIGKITAALIAQGIKRAIAE